MRGLQFNSQMLYFPIKYHCQVEKVTKIFPSSRNIYNVSNTKLRRKCTQLFKDIYEILRRNIKGI